MTDQTATPYLIRAGQGEGIWFVNTLLTMKAGAADAQGAFTLMEQLCPAGFAPPLDVHLDLRRDPWPPSRCWD
jgi:hypothetical protein